MNFPDNIQIVRFGAGILFLILGIGLFLVAKRMRHFSELFTRLISIVVVVTSAMFLIAVAVSEGRADWSAPIYSPDHSKYLRIKKSVGLSLDGPTIVDLYSSHGLISKRIFDSGFNMVIVTGTHWRSNSEVVVTIFDSEGGEIFNDAGQVKVRPESGWEPLLPGSK